MKSTRRDVVRMAALGLVGLPHISRASQPEKEVPSAGEIRERLNANRALVSTMRLRYETVTESGETLSTSDLLFNGRCYYIRREDQRGEMFRMSSPSEEVMGVERPTRTHRYAQTKRWPPEPSLDTFLPTLTLLSAGVSEVRTAEGDATRIEVIQGDTVIHVEPESTVVHERRSIFAPTGRTRLTEVFGDFRTVSPGVVFPFHVLRQRHDRSGSATTAESLVVVAVAFGEKLDPTAFDIAPYREPRRTE